jgi:HEAT repeat protein
MGKNGWRDAGTLMTELEADPGYRARIATQDAEHERIVARNLADAAPLARELAALGFEVEGPGDLFGRNLDYRAAIPLLIRWLPLMDNLDVKCDVMRALSVEWARPAAARPLVDELRQALGKSDVEWERVRYDAANALSVVGDDSVLDDLVELLRDERLETEVRAMLVEALGNVADARGRTCIVEVLDAVQDDERDRLLLIAGLTALRRLRRPETRPVVERYVTHRDRMVRAEAARALKAIDRSAGRRGTTGHGGA